MQAGSVKARRRAIDQQLRQSPPISPEVLEMFASYQGHRPPVPVQRVHIVKRTVVDLDEPEKLPVQILPLELLGKAETGTQKCPHGRKDCHLDPSCTYDTCLIPGLVGRMS